MAQSPERVPLTELLRRAGSGDRAVDDAVFARVRDELRAVAVHHLGALGPRHTLQPTALMHEAWLKLAARENLEFEDRGRFFALTSRIMRGVLVDHARAAAAQKRAGPGRRVTLSATQVEAHVAAHAASEVDLLDLDVALEELAVHDAGLVQLVELRFFGGLTMEAIARELSSSLSTVERQWRLARAWLRTRLDDVPEG